MVFFTPRAKQMKQILSLISSKRKHRCYPYRFFSSPASFVDSELPLDSEGSELLADTFDILSLKEMKLTSMSGPAAEEEPQEDEMAMAKAVLQVAQKKLVSQVRKHTEGWFRRLSQTNVWSLLNFLSVWCSGPKEKLCGECYPYHHQSKEHAGGATFTCPETPYGLPAGDAYRCD